MATRIKKDYNLVALKVVLRTRGDEATIGVDLEITEDHVPVSVWSRSFSANRFGVLPRCSISDARISDFRLPAGLAKAIRRELDKAQHYAPLWLHLVKPYGVLGGLPWEAWLSTIGRPVLRIPDALAPPPVEVAPELDVILCASRPVSEADFSVPHQVAELASAIFRGVTDRDVRLHVFADVGCVREIEQRIASADLPANQVFIKNPEHAKLAADRRAGGDASSRLDLASPWLRWIVESMRGTPVDLVHFMCHGYVADGSGSLAFAQSPTINSDPDWCRFVGGGELGRFLVGVGAWSVGFSSPPSNYSELGLRLLADEFAQVRPGPVFLHDLPIDNDFGDITSAYEFLYARERSMPFPMPTISLCCQPSLLSESQKSAATESAGTLLLRSGNGPQAAVASWLASTQRLLEQKAFDVSRREVASQRLGTSPDASLDGIRRGIEDVEKAFERLNRKGLL